MKGYIIAAFILLAISIFFGFIVFAGLGVFFPGFNQIAAPFVCSNQRLEVEQRTWSPLPGRTQFEITAYCVDNQNGKKQEVTTQVTAFIGTVFSIICYAIAIYGLVGFYKSNKNPDQAMTNTVSKQPRAKRTSSIKKKSSENIDEKLIKLKQLHDTNLITDQEFEKKKAEILEGL
jgi:hypothetical protein